MAITAKISGGACGFETVIEASSPDGMHVTLTIESDCPQVSAMADELTELDAFEQVLRTPLVDTIPMHLAAKHNLHTTCLVPVGIQKASKLQPDWPCLQVVDQIDQNRVM